MTDVTSGSTGMWGRGGVFGGWVGRNILQLEWRPLSAPHCRVDTPAAQCFSPRRLHLTPDQSEIRLYAYLYMNDGMSQPTTFATDGHTQNRTEAPTRSPGMGPDLWRTVLGSPSRNSHANAEFVRHVAIQKYACRITRPDIGGNNLCGTTIRRSLRLQSTN